MQRFDAFATIPKSIRKKRQHSLLVQQICGDHNFLFKLPIWNIIFAYRFYGNIIFGVKIVGNEWQWSDEEKGKGQNL